MSIKKANLSEANIVKNISETTISEIYPHYYPKGAVKFFLDHHSESSIAEDIKRQQVFLCVDPAKNIVGTVTIKANEICRLFVLPDFQGNGYGREMLEFAEKTISNEFSEILLAASLPAKSIYQKMGYKETKFNVIETEYNDFLCYDAMAKQIGEQTNPQECRK